MSWASMARKAQDVEQKSTVPLQIVTAVESSSTESSEPVVNRPDDLDNILRHNVLDLPHFNKGLLVLDANAFIKGLDHLLDVADCIVTITQVVQEVRDRAARELLERLPWKLHVLEPSKESITEVMAIAAKTGDDGAMSRTDIRLCALALDCTISQNCRRERIVPRAPTLNPGQSQVAVVDEEVSESELDEDDNNEEVTAKPAQPQEQEPADDEEDDDGEWITPENISKVVNGTAKHDGVMFAGGVACVTSDFAMQNTLMHLGVPIVGTRGMQIRELRQWILRCHACFRVVADTTRQFCPDCGSGNTLKRVSYVINEDGEKQLFINFKRHISTRGNVYQLPKPRGGRRGTNRTLVLREDQLAHVVKGKGAKGSAEAKLQEALRDDDDEALAVFGEAPKRRAFNPDQPRTQSSYKTYNINERKKVLAARRK